MPTFPQGRLPRAPLRFRRIFGKFLTERLGLAVSAAGRAELLVFMRTERRESSSGANVSRRACRMTPPASPSIPTYIGRSFCANAGGLAQQNYPGSVRVLVIDNNSRDDTQAVVLVQRAARSRHVSSRAGSRFRRIAPSRRHRGAIIVFADDDILMEPDCWRRSPPRLRRRPVEGRRRRRRGDPRFPRRPAPGWRSGMVRWHFARTQDRCSRNSNGANLAFPKWAFEKVACFNTAARSCRG